MENLKIMYSLTDVTTKTKLSVYESSILTVLVYSSETDYILPSHQNLGKLVLGIS